MKKVFAVVILISACLLLSCGGDDEDCLNDGERCGNDDQCCSSDCVYSHNVGSVQVWTCQ